MIVSCGLSLLHSGNIFSWHLGWKEQPVGGFEGDGISPSKIILRCFSSAFTAGLADNNALVYGC